jgi:alkyl sulfatase BDS1-like metallo-beta-lactamase superfamily hydrolase
MLSMLGASGSAREVMNGWRYVLDAPKAGTRELSVGVRLTDTGEEATVHLRNAVLIVEDGITDGADAVVEISSSDLKAMAADSATVVSGDTDVFAELFGYLDTEVVGFSMHQR